MPRRRASSRTGGVRRVRGPGRGTRPPGSAATSRSVTSGLSTTGADAGAGLAATAARTGSAPASSKGCSPSATRPAKAAAAARATRSRPRRSSSAPGAIRTRSAAGAGPRSSTAVRSGSSPPGPRGRCSAATPPRATGWPRRHGAPGIDDPTGGRPPSGEPCRRPSQRVRGHAGLVRPGTCGNRFRLTGRRRWDALASREGP